MNRLEVPELFARRGVDSDEAVGIEIVAEAIAAVEIVRARAGGGKDDAALLIHGNAGPGIGAAGFQIRIFGPGVITLLAGIWDCMEGPEQFAAADVPATEVARRSRRRFAHSAMRNENILVKSSRTGHVDPIFRSRSAQLIIEIYRTILAEVLDGFARVGIQRG